MTAGEGPSPYLFPEDEGVSQRSLGGSPFAAESGAEVIALKDPTHAFVRGAEERAGHRSHVASRANEGIALHFNSIVQVAVAPHDSGSDHARCGVLAPLLEFGKVHCASERSQFEGQVGAAADSLGVRREPQEPTAPTDASGKRDVVCEIRLRRRPDGPRLRQAISQRGTERDVAARDVQFAAHVQRGVGPGSQRFGELGRCDPRLQVGVYGE